MLEMSPFDDKQQQGVRAQDRNRRVLVSTGLVSLLALSVASFLPSVVALSAFSSFLFYAALGALLVALLHRESWRAPHLTGWDQAALLLALALFAGFFADPEAAREYLAERQRSALPDEG